MHRPACRPRRSARGAGTRGRRHRSAPAEASCSDSTAPPRSPESSGASESLPSGPRSFLPDPDTLQRMKPSSQT
eukprot:3855533-Rhodomonas_salina.3